ncbi:MAG: type II toxin-antitoxin system VapC family toxin [Rhodomicrobium sp.]
MIVVDSSALVAILTLEPDAPAFLRIVTEARSKLISAVSLLETSMVLAARKNNSDIWHTLDTFLAKAELEVIAFDPEQALLARGAFIRFGKGRHPAGLNLGDCAAYALAKSRSLPLLFKGNDFCKTDISAAL